MKPSAELPAGHPLAKPGPIERALRRLRGVSVRELFGWNANIKRYGQPLASPVRLVLRDASASLRRTGNTHRNYPLGDVLSEAIEAAEALEL